MKPESASLQTTKQCRSCHEIKPPSAFSVEKGRPRLTCKECRCADAKLRREADIEKSRRKERADYKKNRARKIEEQQRYRRKQGPARCQEANRRSNLKKSFGITVEQYDAMHTAQDGKCAICRKPETNPKISDSTQLRRLAVDHCHDSKIIRELLCSNCNRAIGLLKDDVDLILAAVAYLKKHAEIAKQKSAPTKIIPFAKAAPTQVSATCVKLQAPAATSGTPTRRNPSR